MDLDYLSSMSNPYPDKKFLLIDDHTIILHGLRSLLHKMYDNIIVHESLDGAGIPEKIALINYDLIIMDIHMPNRETMWLIHYIHTNHSGIPVLIYSMGTEKIYAPRVLKAGAKGFISKESSLEELKKAIELTLQGKKYLSAASAELLSDPSLNRPPVLFSILSAREFQVVLLLLSGNTVTEISKILHIGNSTASTHKGNIYTKLNISNLLELKEMSDTYAF